MSTGKFSSVSRDDQFSTISIYEFEKENIKGLFSNNLYGGNRFFGNLISLIILIEDCMNSIAFPQPMAKYRKLENVSEFKRKRRFFRDVDEFTAAESTQIPEEWEQTKPLATFKLRIVFRTISGWQGEVQCLDSGNKMTFKSDLEFIMFVEDELKKLAETA